jgi:predicted short-subunit dehydrogenase-like oxidoreductase (DUF2520 family)
MTREIHHIAIVGSGNVATYMGHLLNNNSYKISAVISRNAMTGQALAEALETSFSAEHQISEDTDLVLLCVNDDDLRNASESLASGRYAVCHCAGSLPMDILDRHALRGVLYPLQSIHSDTNVEEAEVPFLIEASSNELQKQLEDLLRSCRKSFHIVNSDQRLAYHLAAVFANNFTNAMMVATEEISTDLQLDFSLLQPLIAETFNRIEKHRPANVQTGPAKRNDQEAMKRHLAILSKYPDMKALYESISAYIMEKFGKANG